MSTSHHTSNSEIFVSDRISLFIEIWTSNSTSFYWFLIFSSSKNIFYLTTFEIFWRSLLIFILNYIVCTGISFSIWLHGTSSNYYTSSTSRSSSQASTWLNIQSNLIYINYCTLLSFIWWVNKSICLYCYSRTSS